MVALVLLVMTGCSSTAEGTGDKGYISGDGKFTLLDPADREDPIELVGEDLDGDRLSVTDMRGGAVVVNVWWSLCGPCRVEMPDLVQASEELPDVEFVGINIRDTDVQKARLFNEQFEVPYPSIFSPEGQALLAFSGTLTPRTIPSTVVLDAQGRIAATVIGPIPSTTTFVDLVSDIAAEGPNG